MNDLNQKFILKSRGISGDFETPDRGREGAPGAGVFFCTLLSWMVGEVSGDVVGFRRDAVEIMDGFECSMEVSLGDISIYVIRTRAKTL